MKTEKIKKRLRNVKKKFMTVLTMLILVVKERCEIPLYPVAK